MIISWMLTTLVFGLCVALAALSAEPLVRALRRPVRWSWTIALAVATLWPVAWLLASAAFPTLRTVAQRLPTATVAPVDLAMSPGPFSLMESANRAAIVLWCAASLLLGIRLARALVALRRVGASAERRTIDDVSVLVADGVGPAAIGMRRYAVIVPRALLDLEQPLRRLVLEHEREHCAAGDPRLFVAAALSVVVFPWNPALWVIARRLHLALELDCDDRVLAHGADPIRYGRLLLVLGQHRPAASVAPMLVSSLSHLERRIIAMRTRLDRPRPGRLVAAGMLLGVGIAGACSQGTPDAPASRPAGVTEAVRVPSGAEFVRAADRPAKQLPGTGQLRYPDDMRRANREGEVIAQFVIGTDGLAELSSFKVVRSSDPAFTKAVREALPTMRFQPALVGGRAVRQLLEQPFTFGLQSN